MTEKNKVPESPSSALEPENPQQPHTENGYALVLKEVELETPEFPKKSNGLLNDLLKERREHREKLLKFVRWLTMAAFSLLALIIISQGIVRIFDNPSFTILDDNQLNILVVGVFGQIIGVVCIIVKSLWDDKSYLDKID